MPTILQGGTALAV